jgi:hypothetical protein
MGQKRVRRQPLDQDDVRDAHGISYYILAGYIEVCPVPISSFRLTYPASHLEAFFGIAIQSNSDRLTAAQAETLDELNKRIKKQLSFPLG